MMKKGEWLSIVRIVRLLLISKNGRMTLTTCHPELVSGFHHNGDEHDGYLACGMLKQVQHDGFALVIGADTGFTPNACARISG